MSRSTRARQELAAIPNLIARYKQAILTAAFNGDLTADWRAKYRVSESASALIERTPTPMQPRGGREASERTIPGVAGLSVNHPNTEPPPGWCWTPITRIARQETGHTPSRSHPDWWVGEIPWIGIKDASLHHGGYIRDTIQHTNEQGLANSAARLLPTNTVCLSRTASVGYVVIMARPMATSQDFVTWSCTEALMPEYLAFALMAEGDDIRRFGKGSTHTTIYFPEVRALHICLAPIEEQIEIVKRVKVALEKINSIEKELSRTEKLRTRLEQATLAKAFRGELAPQDPSDEPASTLLDRIRATRQQSPQPKRGRKKS
jgi:type I restriction enzyme S subunit